MTATEVRALPAIVDVVTAAEVLGIGRTVAYELVRTNRFPTPVVRVGHQIKIPTPTSSNCSACPQIAPRTFRRWVRRIGIGVRSAAAGGGPCEH